jgi:hypothetical protein
MRDAKIECELARNRVDLYEGLAPWLAEYTDLSLDELLASVRESRSRGNDGNEKEEDPITKFVPMASQEWKTLSSSERNQLALDRYLNPKRKKSLWQIGIDFERYVGYYYEQLGYKVRFHGALRAREDLGIDLICENSCEILIIQCKRLSNLKGIPVRENTVAQIFGAAKFFESNPKAFFDRLGVSNAQPKKTVSVRPVLVTSYELSETAEQFSKALDVEVVDNFVVGKYPVIKCNVAPRTGEKIYHLPMDQQYDTVVIGDQEEECYVETVAEAEQLGFRRAYRWKGDGVE